NRARGPQPDLRGVPADRSGCATARRHRARACTVEAFGRAPRRPDLGRQRGRPREHVHVQPAGGAGVAMAGEQVLVVEDNEKNMKLFRDVLEASGYRLLEATTGHDALALAANHEPDLV